MRTLDAEALKQPAPASSSTSGAEEAYLDGEPFTSDEDEQRATREARQSAPLVLATLEEQLGTALQHCIYPCGTIALVTADEEHFGLALDPSPAALAEITVHRGFADKFDVVKFTTQPRTTLISFPASAASRTDIAVGLRGRKLMSRDIAFCECDLDLDPDEIAWTSHPTDAVTAELDGEDGAEDDEVVVEEGLERTPTR